MHANVRSGLNVVGSIYTAVDAYHAIMPAQTTRTIGLSGRQDALLRDYLAAQPALHQARYHCCVPLCSTCALLVMLEACWRELACLRGHELLASTEVSAHQPTTRTLHLRSMASWALSLRGQSRTEFRRGFADLIYCCLATQCDLLLSAWCADKEEAPST